MQYLGSGLVSGCDQSGDAVEGAGGPDLLGQFGQRAPGAHDALLAFDRQKHGGGRIELLGKLFLRRHGCPFRWRIGRARLTAIA
ncbi:hypothetical protein GCM10010207_68230 [Streptomyces atratus]|nr:hypothetical protein GCM10010207_68230 [Streptomyces atratus]